MKLSREDELKEARLFWSRCWSGVSPQRLSSYREHLDLAPDAILDFLIDRGLRRVCDAGCGCGAYSLKLAQHGFSVSGFDISEEAVALADRLLSGNGFPACDFRVSDLRSTGYADGCFDAVVARDVLDHLPIRHGIPAAAELLRIVRPGGYVLLTLDEPDGEYETEPHEICADGDYRYTEGKWRGMVFHPYSPVELERLTQKASRVLPLPASRGCSLALEK